MKKNKSGKIHTVGILTMIKETGMTKKEVLTHIKKGNIKAGKKGQNLVFKSAQLRRLKKEKDAHIGVWQMVNELLDVKAVFAVNKPTNRKEFIDFLIMNKWFGITPIPSEDVYFATTKGEEYFVKNATATPMVNHISLWLNSYGRSDAVKMKLLLEWIKSKHPKTGSLISEFILNNNPSSKAIWILLDYLSSKLKYEIIDMGEEQLEDLSTAISQELPLNSAKVFSAFLLYLKANEYMPNGWNYHYGVRSKSNSNNSYSMSAFLRMAHIVFNDAMWQKNNLLKKALESKRYANLWLFVALHFICGWHGTDIVRLPKPNLAQSGKTIREQIKASTYNTEAVICELELRLRIMPLKANKTKDHNHVPELKIFFPESLRIPLGTIVAIAASWCDEIQEGMPFVKRAGDIPDIKKFFGSDFLSICEDKRFSTRRANKAYLQGVEKTADSYPGKPKGYMLAALARSHKGGIGKLPEVTDIYLKDANFSGYTSEFIAREMFERGVLSFIPSIMLEMYSKEIYKKLHLSAQTSLITNIGVSPTGIENISKLSAKSMHSAKEAVLKIINQPEEMRGSISEILQNIASGNAASKLDGCMCLLTAANFSCSEPERSSCIGCGYEIYTKSIIRCLAKEYKRLIERKKNSYEKEAIRCSNILKTAILPALTEVITSIKQIYPSYDAVQIVEGVLNDATNENKYNR